VAQPRRGLKLEKLFALQEVGDGRVIAAVVRLDQARGHRLQAARQEALAAGVALNLTARSLRGRARPDEHRRVDLHLVLGGDGAADGRDDLV
jgi:hypothetical protein